MQNYFANWAFSCILVKYPFNIWRQRIVGSRYSRMEQVKFVEDRLQNILSDMVCLGRPYHFKFFKGCLPQILLGPFLSTLELPVIPVMEKRAQWNFSGTIWQNINQFCTGVKIWRDQLFLESVGYFRQNTVFYD